MTNITMDVVLPPATPDDYANEAKVGDESNSEAADPEATGYTIDELTAASKVPSRTIRFYQSKGVLPHPEKRGRVAFYTDDHLERLQLIAKLQDRGLRISAIRTLLGRIDSGEVDLAEWLGLEAQLTASWADDQPRTLTKDELHDMLGSKRAGLIGDLMRLDAVERTGEVYLVRSPALLATAMRLEAAGVDLDSAHEGEKVLRKYLGRAAKDLASYYFSRAEKGVVEPPPDGDWSRLLETLRPQAIDAVKIIFGQEMERVLRELVESGKMNKLPTRRKKTSRRRS
jgi:DNA-binding transcriptional MerR regulator